MDVWVSYLSTRGCEAAMEEKKNMFRSVNCQ